VLAQVHEEPGHAEADALALARACLARGDAHGAFRHLTGARTLAEDGLLALAALHRRRSEWDAAAEIWSGLAERGSCRPALENLAKYYEHVRHDHATALDCARRLLQTAPGNPDYRHREQRLLSKLRVRAAFTQCSMDAS
jgi:uncharacterized protein